MERIKHKLQKYWGAILIIMIVILVMSAFCIGILSIQSIRSHVRSTTIQVIQEITSNKSQMLITMLEESQRDIRDFARALNAVQDQQTVADLVEKFERDHALNGLTIMDGQGNALYGPKDAYLLKGIPPDFAQAVASNGFAISDALIGENGSPKVLFGTLLRDGQSLYASLTSESMQKACGETTYLGEGYSYILGCGGKILIPPVRYSYEQVYENMHVLLIQNGNPAEKIDRFIQALDSGRAGSVVFTIDDKEQLLCFEPVNRELNWQLVTIVPLKAVEKDGAKIIQTAMMMATIIISVIVAALAVGSILYWSMQRKQQENSRFLLHIYQAISENIDTVIFILNSRGTTPDYVFENSGRLLGIPAEEFLTEQPNAQKSTFRKELQSLLEEPWPSEGCRRMVHTYNDRLHYDMWLKVLVCPFRLGNELKCIYAVTDVTQEHNDREKIAAAVVAAEQANAAKSSFFSSMSHDMRTPMNGIVGMTAIAKRSLDDRDRVLDCLNKIDFSSKHLLGLINDVLDMSKIESGKLALSSEPFDLVELLQGLEAILRPQCDSKQQTLTSTINITHSRLVGDPLRLNQIFMNLLSNAVKFTQEGGAIVLNAQERGQQDDSATYRFTVADNGIGISPEAQKVIFTPFERASDTAVRQIEGTGLGLAITKNLISAMGGQITLVSALGQGATFIVDLELPLQKNEAQASPVSEAVTLDEASFAGRRFLLAEDNAINQEIAVELLTGYGAAVDTSDNGKQALERFIASAPGYYDAILMDIQMPVMNGYEATRQIRACGHPQAKSILIVAMTANVFTEDVLAARNAGMDAHIPKPINLEALYLVLQERATAGD